jgi:predicted Fe-Mo cluster-binding NifX family protein
MKIAFSATGRDLGSEIDPRFGRCTYFLIVDPDDMNFEAFENESVSLGGGAGIQSAQFVASKGVSAVITGNVGPNAMRTLNEAGIEVIIGVSGSIREATARYKRGELSSANQANVTGHYGMGSSQAPYPGGGMGMGRGMGRGRGMSMGRGMGMQGGFAQNQGTSAPSSAQELRALKEEAEALRGHLTSILSRIKDLEEN